MKYGKQLVKQPINERIHHSVQPCVVWVADVHSLVFTVRVVHQVGHRDEGVLQSFTGSDSQIPIQMQQPLQQVHKSLCVLSLSGALWWILLGWDTVSG